MKNQIPKAVFDSMMIDVKGGQKAITDFMVATWPSGPPGGFGIFGLSLVSVAVQMVASNLKLNRDQTNRITSRVLPFVRDEFKQYEATENDKQNLAGAVKPADVRHN